MPSQLVHLSKSLTWLNFGTPRKLAVPQPGEPARAAFTDTGIDPYDWVRRTFPDQSLHSFDFGIISLSPSYFGGLRVGWRRGCFSVRSSFRTISWCTNKYRTILRH